MTLDQRVDKLLAELYPPAMFTAAVTEAMRPVLRHALIEQDKITRHAAARDVNSVHSEFVIPFGNTAGEGIPKDGERIIAECYAAVMNCKGGVE